MNYKVVLEAQEEGGFTVYVPSLPGCVSQGESETEALANIKEAIEVYLESLALGYIDILVRAGASVVTPGCAACLGTHAGILASGEVCISSTNRNFPGRMGHTSLHIPIR